MRSLTLLPAMMHWLLIPWFKLEPIAVPLPFDHSLPLQPFGVLAAVAVAVGTMAARHRASQLDVSRETLDAFLTCTTLTGLIGAYLLNIVMYSPDLVREILDRPTLLFERWYGLSSYGGFVSGALAAVWFARQRRMSLLVLGDIWCFAFPFAWTFARLGCFSVHDHPGIASEFPLAVANWNGSGVARHDLGLYEVLWAIPVAALFFVRSRQQQTCGSYLALVCCLYGPVRHALDFLRADTVAGGDIRYGMLTPAQYLSLALTVAGLLLAIHVRRRIEQSDLLAYRTKR